MDIILSALTGIAIKIYDDISDNGIVVNETYSQFLKTFQLIGLTIISSNDFTFSSTFFLVNILSFLGDRDAYLTDYFHKSILFLYPILILTSFQYRSYPNIISILYLLWFVIFFTLEPYITPEEFSERKGLIRLATSIFIYFGLFVGKYLGVSNSCLKMGSICLGYIFSSTLFQFYMLNKHNDKLLQTLVLYC